MGDGHPPRDRPKSGRLVMVSTPIGNLDDLSPRAAQALHDADVVAAEDTRRSRVLLQRVGSTAATTSYHEHNEAARTRPLLDRVEAGQTVVCVTDAGTPGVADPGFRLVREAVARGLSVEVVPGPSALLAALVVSGLPTDRFAFEGFLPRKSGARAQRLAALAGDPRTLVFYVAPHRAAADLAAMAVAFGDRPAVLARELTKLHEEVWRGGLEALAERARVQRVRGEVTVVVAGTPTEPEPAPPDELAARVAALEASGRDRKSAIAEVAAAAGVSRRRVYQAVLDHR